MENRIRFALPRSVRVSSNNITKHVAKLALFLCVSLAVSLCSLITTASATAVTLKLSSTSGPPSTNLLVSGSGYPAYTAVDIYFDTTDTALAVTNGTGAFSGIGLQVPASAVPGTHWVTGVARGSGTAAQAPFLVRTNWAQFHYSPLHKGVNPFENVLSPATVGSIDLHWSYTTGNFVISSPAVANGVVYAGSYDFNVYALNASTGAKLWSFPTSGSGGVFSSPAVANGVVYVGSDDKNVYALNAKNGAKLWSFPTGGGVFSSPAVANGVVYVGSVDFNVYALNAKTGAKLWSFPTGGAVYSSPAVANGVVYVGSFDENVYALDASTGFPLWQYTTGASIRSSPAVANGVVYVGSFDKNLYAFDETGGMLAKEFRAPARPDPMLLRPDLKLQPSLPVTSIPRTANSSKRGQRN